MSERRRAGIRAAVERGQAVTPEHQPKPLRFLGRRPLEGEKKRYHELQQRRDTRAAELGIDPTIIASRSVLSDLAHNWEKHSPELMDWQRKLLQPIT
jgi:ribonuclease D